jgi:prepilin-type N-terminal cleavage/methylation domain-containing protein
MRDARQERKIDDAERGFTLIEVLISMAITVIVMGAVFGLLTRGQRSFQREPEVADLQQSARTALDMVTKVILQAGAGLPPEFPAFSRIGGAGNANPTDVLEIIGGFPASSGGVSLEPEDIERIDPTDPNRVIMRANTTNLDIGDMVVLYNNVANNDPLGRVPHWAMAKVTDIVEDPGNPAGTALVTLDHAAYPAAYSNHTNGGGNPPDPADFAPAPPVVVPKITRVSVVRYFTQPDTTGSFAIPPQVLMRELKFRNPAVPPEAVGYLEDFQIGYVIGVTAPVEQDDPPDPVTDMPATALTAENMLSSVRITVTARSVSAGLEGASEGASAGPGDDFIRKTFSTNVNPRNLSAGVDMRALTTPIP